MVGRVVGVVAGLRGVVGEWGGDVWRRSGESLHYLVLAAAFDSVAGCVLWLLDLDGGGELGFVVVFDGFGGRGRQGDDVLELLFQVNFVGDNCSLFEHLLV